MQTEGASLYCLSIKTGTLLQSSVQFLDQMHALPASSRLTLWSVCVSSKHVTSVPYCIDTVPVRAAEAPVNLRHFFVIEGFNITANISWDSPMSVLPITAYQLHWTQVNTFNRRLFTVSKVSVVPQKKFSRKRRTRDYHMISDVSLEANILVLALMLTVTSFYDGFSRCLHV